MGGFSKCPECGEYLGYMYEAYAVAKEIHNKKCIKENSEIDISCIDLKPGVIKPVGEILDFLKLNNECCRMHVMCYVDFDNIHKTYA